MSPSILSTTPPQEISTTSKLTANAVSQTLANAARQNVKHEPILRPLDASSLTYVKTMSPRAVLAHDDPIRNTASYCTDHMITCQWTAAAGWAIPELKPFGPLSLLPTASVLHYATECFEGMKAYRGYDGKLRLFRPDCNAARMLSSATRISLPAFQPAEFEKLVLALMAVDGPKFLPRNEPGTFIYLRPTMIGDSPGLGVTAPHTALLFIIATYMPEMSEPENGMRLLASQNDTVRAWPGGFGFAKVGANYGPSLMATSAGQARGYDQILWLFGDECQVTEAGASNFFLVWKTKSGRTVMQTAPIGDKIILEGVTRRSVLQLARERLNEDSSLGLPPLDVVEETFCMQDIVEAVEEGRMVEAFACGTAYFVCPVSEIHFANKDLVLPMVCGKSGAYTAALKQWLKDIMYGPEAHPWGVVVDEKTS